MAVYQEEAIPREPPAVALEGIVKTFGAKTVLHGVDFAVRAGEIHGLAGANGSGKSTLMKVLYGVHPPTCGTLSLGGSPVRLRDPGHALRCGVAAVPQELPLVGSLTVAENVLFGRLPRRARLVDWAQVRRQARRALAAVDPDGRIDAGQRVGQLDVASQQLVSIARTLAHGARILVFDEPTSALDAAAARNLLSVITRLRAGGAAIAFISQRLEDLVAVADRVAVLRDGRLVADEAVDGLGVEGLARLMVDAPAGGSGGRRSSGFGAPVLEASGMAAGRTLRDASFQVAAGEVVGIAGLPGSGVEHVLPVLAGKVALQAGTVRAGEADISRWHLRRRVGAGIAYVSGDRRRQGLMLSQTVELNLALAANRSCGLLPLSRRAQRAEVVRVARAVGLVPPDPDMVVGSLSGGNQQKVVIGRWVLGDARIWLLDDPTRGVDVRAREEIHTLIRSRFAVRPGSAAVVTSSDTLELLQFCDRIVVLNRGRVAATVEAAASSEEEILALAGGVTAEAHADPTGRSTPDGTR